MQYKSNKGYSGFSQLGMLLAFVGLGLILATIAQLIIGLQMVPKGTSILQLQEAMMTAMKDPKNVQTIRILQIAGTFCLMFIPSVMFSWIVNGNNPFWLGFNKYFNVQQIALGFVIIFSANILAGPLQDLSEKVVSYLPSLEITAKNLENLYNDQVQALSHLSGLPDLFLALIIMAFFPALFEELFFRGVMQNLFIKWWKKPILAIIITSIIFSLIHISIYLFLSRIVLGFVLGLMFYKTKNIWVNTIAHFLNNAIAVLQMYALSQSKTKSDIDVSKLDPKFDWWMGLAALAVLYFLFKYLNRYSEENKMKIYTKEQALLVNETQGNPLA
jgi:membrane protease YdiL (CAAX protease family)